MKEAKEIRKDLRQIRYYYTRIQNKCVGTKVGVLNAIEELVQKYNAAIKNAPVQSYDLYCAMYIEGNTLDDLADKWGFDRSTMHKYHKALVAYLQSKID